VDALCGVPVTKPNAAEVRRLVADVQAHLTDDLRQPKYRGRANPMAGHCYVATETLSCLLGGPKKGWHGKHLRHEGDTHWFLQHESGMVVDATASQFRTPVPYEQGIGAGFQSKPCHRTEQLLRRMGRKACNVKQNPIVAKGSGAMNVQPGKISGYSLTKPNHYLYPSCVEVYALARAQGPSEPGRDCAIFAFADKKANIVICRLWVQPCCVDKRADPDEARFVLETFAGRHAFHTISDHTLQKWNSSPRKWVARGKRFENARLLCERIAKAFKAPIQYRAHGAAGMAARKSTPFVFLPEPSDKIVTGRGGWMYPRILDTFALFTTGAPFSPPRNSRLFMTATDVLRLEVQPPCVELREGKGKPRYALYRFRGEYPRQILDPLVTGLPVSSETEKEIAGNRLRRWKANNEIYSRDFWDKVIITESTQEMVERFTELATGGTELDWRDTQMTYPEDYYSNPAARRGGSYLDRLVAFYGITHQPTLGAWLLPTGEFLDFSEGSGSRSQDHRNINWVSTVPEKPDQSRYDVMARIAKRVGMYRWMPEAWSIEAWTPPTPEQARVMRELHSMQPIIVEATRPQGRKFYGERFYREYEQWDNPSEPARELRDFYANR
jgi:hypothetical protein